jgi:nucleoside recognition membrane protein YjiH
MHTMYFDQYFEKELDKYLIYKKIPFYLSGVPFSFLFLSFLFSFLLRQGQVGFESIT